jgi:hypothetical protein
VGISCAPSESFSDATIGGLDVGSSLSRSGASLDEPFEAVTADANLFAKLLEVCASISRNDRPEAFVAPAWFEAILPFTGLDVIRTPHSLHVTGQRLTKTKIHFIAGN